MAKTPLDMVDDMDDPNVEVKGKMAEAAGQEQTQTATDQQTEAVQSQQAKEQVQTEQVRQTAAVQTEKPKADAQQAEQPATSFLAETEDEQVASDEEQQAGSQQKRSGLIPDLQKERQKRHAAEQEAAQLRQQLQQQAEQQPEQVDLDAEIKALLGDGDDDFIEKKTLAGVLGKVASTVAKKTRQDVLSEVNQQRQAEKQDEQTRAQKAAANQRLRASENAARKVLPDFDAVVQTALNTGSVTPEEIAAIKRAPNPAMALYRKSKEIVALFGIQPQQAAPANQSVQQNANAQQGSETQQKETPAADGEIQNDEDFMKSCGFTSRGR